MSNQTETTIVKNATLASSAAILSVVLLTVLGELNPPLKNWLTTTFSHHWIGKSVISILVFAVSFALLWPIKLKALSTAWAIWLLVLCANISFLLILTFFFLEAV